MIKHIKLTITELVFISVLAIALGIIYTGYSFIYHIIAPILNMFGMSGLLRGIYLFACVFFPYIIRKPGSALIGQLIATIVESVFAGWGMEGLLYGLVQGLVAEIFFLFMGYKLWNTYALLLAAVWIGLITFIISSLWYSYYIFGIVFILVHLISILISSLLFSGFLAKYVADKLALTGVLNNFAIIKDSYR